ncbi:unnamed protein product [Owenia fusiformis]|uniref:carbonic anhydrase n=1 Tax=Owenia fusiformis TaxID=6347 RepID=A0A8J1XPR7_OWEFU|nr:unnamed protein product [Owenia fusiformis]
MKMQNFQILRLILLLNIPQCWSIFTTTVGDTCTADWQYRGSLGEDKWSTFCPQCKANMQSPIYIKVSSLLYAPNLDLLSMENYDSMRDIQVTNIGRSVMLDLRSAGEYWLSRGNLPGKYLADQMHFHWGSDSSRGSDHRVDGRQFPLEMHIVYDLMDQVKDREMIAAVSVLFEVSSEDNADLQPLIQALSLIKTQGQKTTLPYFMLSKFLPRNLKRFYRYYGSLTTPPCLETVVWTVFKETVKVSERQLSVFRSLTYRDNESGQNRQLANNFRKIQSLNGRIVYSTEDRSGVTAGAFAAIGLTVVILVIGLGAFFAFAWPKYKAKKMRAEDKQPIVETSIQ